MTMIHVERLRQALADTGASQSELARYVGVTPAAIQQLVSGKTRRSVHLSKIARFLNVGEDWLIGEGNERAKHAGLVEEYTRYMPLVDLDTASASALGNISTVSYDVAFLPFENEVKPSDNPNKSRWVMFTNVGDDMAPIFRHNDHVVLDMNERSINRHDAIWLVRVENDLPMLRYADRLAGNKVRLHSANGRVGDIEVAVADLEVSGRVVWQARLW